MPLFPTLSSHFLGRPIRPPLLCAHRRTCFELIITDKSLVYRRTDETIAAEARLDGIYVIRTNVPKEALSPEDTVGAYKALAQVERAFRSVKTVDLEIRPAAPAPLPDAYTSDRRL